MQSSSENKAPVRSEQADVLIAYLEGRTVEVCFTTNPTEKHKWEHVAPYKEPHDVFRLTYTGYSFRIK